MMGNLRQGPNLKGAKQASKGFKSHLKSKDKIGADPLKRANVYV